MGLRIRLSKAGLTLFTHRCLLDWAYDPQAAKNGSYPFFFPHRCLLDRAYKSDCRKRVSPFLHIGAYLILLTNPACICIAPKMPRLDLSMYEFGPSSVSCTIKLLSPPDCRRIHGLINLHFGHAPSSCYNTWSNGSHSIWFHRIFQISAF